MTNIENKKKNYVPLHNHSHYSLLDGFADVDDYIKVAKENEMIGIGLTDHGTASALYEFVTKTQDAGLIPVPGLEFYVAPENPEGAKAKRQIFYGPNGRRAPKYDVGGNGSYLHLTVIAYNNKGLENIFKLTSLSWKQENYYYKPRIDTNMLAEHSEGLIVFSGCPSSEINRRFLLGQDKKAYEYAERLKDIFKDNFYVELMNHEMDEDLERILIPKLIKMAQDLDLPMVATNDSHYAFKENAKPHERMLAVQSGSYMSIPGRSEGGVRFDFSGPEYYIKTYDEMLELFPESIAEEALANTEKIAKQCEGISIDYDPHLRPQIDIPEGYTNITYLQKLISDGFQKKRGGSSREVQEESLKRIKHEFEVLHSNDFIDYFLVVHDYIDFAHRNGISIGFGRGSVGGSEIAYVLDISNTDPIRYNLLFERFLSPGRGALYQVNYVDGTEEELSVSDRKVRMINDGADEESVYIHELNPGDAIHAVEDGSETKIIKDLYVKRPGSAPDVDTDFHTQGRERVIEYVTEKYGKDNVANIITFQKFKAKSAFKTMCTIYQVPYAQANRISAMIPDPIDNDDVSIKDLLDPLSPRYAEGEDFRNATAGPEWEELIDMAIQIEGRISSTGVHPCGVIISNQPLAGIIPTQVRQDDGITVTQWEYPQLESMGLIKMDFLGLENIDIIDATLDNIKTIGKPVPDMNEIINGEMDDPKVYEMLGRGDTVGIFQLGRPGVRQLLQKAKPTKFMDIATITALYRPGPMSTGSHNEWAERLNGNKPIKPIHPEFSGTVIDDILEETSGLVVFQEQLMKIATEFAGMTPYESETLRKAMGKKKMATMMQMQPKFIQGSMDKAGVSEEAANVLWDTLEGFAQYGFNKSHSVSYALVAYQNAYLKANYPAEYMAAVIQQKSRDIRQLAQFIQEAVGMGLSIGPVDINKSQVYVAPTAEGTSDYDIIYGFAAVKHVNLTVANEIVKEREENGEYKSVADFSKRLSSRAKISSQALANLALSGAFDQFGVSRKMVVEKARELLTSGAKSVSKGASLFDLIGSDEGDIAEQIELKGEEYSYNEKIKLEADRIGLFISGHPTSNLGVVRNAYQPTTLAAMAKAPNRYEGKIFGTFTQIVNKTSRNGKRSIEVIFDDGSDSFRAYLPNNVIAQSEKAYELNRIDRAAEKGETVAPTKRSEAIQEALHDPSVIPLQLEENDVYLITAVVTHRNGRPMLRITEVENVETTANGSIPYEIEIEDESVLGKVEKLASIAPGDTSIKYTSRYDGSVGLIKNKVQLSRKFIMTLEKIPGVDITTEGV